MSRTYVIAEAGVNHNGSLDKALELVAVAAEAGADAVKFQTFKADKLVSARAPKAAYQRRATGDQESQLAMVKALELAYEHHHAVAAECRKRKIEFLSTPFDSDSLAFLVGEMKIARLKMPSGELTNAPFLLEAAKAGRPLIVSTGMSTLGEVEQALQVIAFGLKSPTANASREAFLKAYATEEARSLLKERVVLLHCTSEYPAPFAEINLRAMATLAQAFQLPIGLSDHSDGIHVPIAAVAMGATVIEKHFTLDRRLPGPDHKASLEPDELAEMVKGIRQVESALGNGVKVPTAAEYDTQLVARKVLVANRPIRRGERIAADDIAIKRAGQGVAPIDYWTFLGRVAGRDFAKDEPLDGL